MIRILLPAEQIYAHVTFFFNGGRETPFENEDRILVPSPKVATYDLQPEMSAPIVTEKLLAAIDTNKEDLIILNYANGDMLGHTGVYDAICKAVRCIDGCVEKVVTEAIKHNYVIIITADHGNADHAVNDDGTPNTAQSLNPVQFIVVNAGDAVKSLKDGALCNVAPTILKLMGLFLKMLPARVRRRQKCKKRHPCREWVRKVQQH